MKNYYKKTVIAGLILLSSISLGHTLEAAPKKLTLDAAHSSINFSIKHLAISKVKGSFRSFTTDVVWDRDATANSSLSGEIIVESIDTGNEKRDSHLKSGDFFNLKDYPSITYKSKHITKVSDTMYTVVGEFTMKDVTKTISFPLEIVGEATGPSGHNRIAMEAELSLNRFDYNVKWNNVLKDGNLIVDDTVKISITTQFIEK